MEARSLAEARPAPAAVTELDLSGQEDLTELPEEILALTNLTALNVSHSGLQRLPPWIAKLPKLARLSLIFTKIRDLPGELAAMPALERLHVGSWELQGVPEVIGRTRLRTLEIATNSFTDADGDRIAQNRDLRSLSLTLQRTAVAALPASIYALRKLERFELKTWNGTLAGLDGIQRMTALRDLELEVSGAPALPDALQNLQNLETLKLEMSAATALPPSLAALDNLQKLEIWRTPLSALPDDIGKLARLRQLSIYETKMTALPGSVTNLAALQTLHLWNTPIAALPDDIERLVALAELQIERCPVAHLPATLVKLPKLVRLTLQATGVTRLPAGIAALAGLQVLVLSNSPVAELPAEIGGLSALDYLNLEGTKIAELPPAIGDLERLYTLNVSETPLSELPAALSGCTRLNSLSLTGCTFSPAGMRGLAALRKKRGALRVDEPRAAPKPAKPPKKAPAKGKSAKTPASELSPAVTAQLARLGLTTTAPSGKTRALTFPRGEVAMPEPLRRFYDDVEWPPGEAFTGQLETSQVPDLIVGENADNLDEYECIHHKPYLPVAWSGEFALHYMIDLDDPTPADPKVYLLGAAAYRVTTPRLAFKKLSAFLAQLARK